MSKTMLDRIYHDETMFGGNREKSLIRDNYACRDCGTEKSLVTHHIDKSGQGANPNNDLENLITLCRACHMRRHKGDNRSGSYSACEYCGNEIYVKKSDTGGRHKYCSKECRDKGNGIKSITAIMKNCQVCDREFKAIPANILLGKAKYCSRECSSIGQRKRVLMFCKTCGAGFEVEVGRVESGRKKYCSNLCFLLRKI